MIHDMKTEAKQEIAWRNSLKHLVNKRVEVEYSQSVDWAGFSGTKRGWLQEYEGRLILVARRGSNRFINLTGGMFDGFHSTITVKNIRQV